MSLDWCPGIRDACAHWKEAPMLQHTFQALEAGLENESDACIDAAKGLVECVCHVIVDELDDPTAPLKPSKSDVSITEWLSVTTRALQLTDVRHRGFADLIKCHSGLSEALRVLRNDAGPVSHGKDGFIQTLSKYHRRAAILSADAIVTFLHEAYLELQPDPLRSREPWERFESSNALIDRHVGIALEMTDDDDVPTLRIQLPTGDELPIKVEVSRLLYALDREAYVEALNASKGIVESDDDMNEEFEEGDDATHAANS
jgi:Abortive infection C-terminus